VISLVAGGGWYYTRLQTALTELAHEHRAAERQVERLHLLLEMTHQLVRTPDLDTVLRLISETTARLANAERSTVFVVDRAKKEIWSKVAMGEGVGEIRLPLGEGIAGTVAQTGRTMHLPDAYAHPKFNPDVDRRTGYRTRNLLALPLRGPDSKVIGVLQILNKRGGPFQPDDVEMLTGLATAAAVALERTCPA
jgi:GAF domain-containing protein